jgi:arginine/lysine/histidine transporter system substrate-binding protein
MKKFFAMALSCTLCLSMLAGCGDSAASSAASETATAAPTEAAAETETSTTDEAASTTEAVATDFTTVEDGKLHMATNAAFPPYEMVADDGTFEGIDVEIAGKIAEKLGLELVVDDMDFGSIITSVQTGKSDIAMAGLTVTEDRKKNVDFSDTYATGVQVVIVPEDSEIATIDDLQGKLIGCQESTTGYIYCSDDYGEDMVTAFPNGANAVQALLSGKVDAVVIDSQPAQEFVAQNEGLKILDTEYVTEDYAIGISKDNTALRDAVNNALKELIDDGTVQSILDKYITAE